MSDLRVSDFAGFFEAVHGFPPYPWQERLAAMAVDGRWPDVVDLPTGSGKTACIDVAVFALACQAARPLAERNAPRRIFFCVNRRVIVDEAYERSLRLARRLFEAESSAAASGVLARVARALREVAGADGATDGPPLDVLELRGGVYRDNRWARSATQPTVVCTTVDQLGSRLLFRGYGVSPLAAPIQAALIAWDSLVLLDEAHVSRPFLQTLESVRRFVDPQVWAEDGLALPRMRVVPMTATPPEAGEGPMHALRLDDRDRETPALLRRLAASKPARLVVARRGATTAAIVEEALALVGDEPLTLGVLVNRVQRAREVCARLIDDPGLRRRHRDLVVELVIGAMRPHDRDLQAARLAPLVGPRRPQRTERTCIVVATQCLEVGADYDFDALVTECASLDALRQRFGRLNRAGRPVEARGVVVMDPAQRKPAGDLREDKPLDPIYGNAIARTWAWLSARAGGEEGVVDFGIDAMSDVCMTDDDVRELLAPSARLDAPTLLPSHLDLWVQTAPRPQPDPEVSLFLHGPQRDTADVMVCWRADLDPGDTSDWAQTVGLLPPSATECMTVGIARMRTWLAGELAGDGGSDLLGELEEEPRGNAGSGRASARRALVWRGRDEAVVLEDPSDLRPGDTVVLPAAAGGWNELGHVPEAPASSPEAIDVAELAFRRARARPALRLHPALQGRWTDVPGWRELLETATDPDEALGPADWRRRLADLRDSLPEVDLRRQPLDEVLRTGLVVQPYPKGRGVVLTGRRRIPSVWFLPEVDEGDDTTSRIDHPVPVPLDEHLEHVHGVLLEVADRLPLERWRRALEAGVLLHDIGKADERFQALLLGQDRTAAWFEVAVTGMRPLAKSDALPMSPRERALARRRAQLPRGFRHEMLSLQMAEQAVESPLPKDLAARDLALHVVASHHGYARPFAPVVLDEEPPTVALELSASDQRISVSVDGAWRAGHPAHRADAGVADRFWRLVRRHGWWGLAFLEAVVRLADQTASARESAGLYAMASSEDR